MTLPRKTSRKIVVNGVRYRWASSGNDDGVHIFVETDGGGGQLLTAVIPYQEAGANTSVTPKDVELLIDLGLATDWRPRENGPVFKVDTVSRLGQSGAVLRRKVSPNNP